MQRTRRTVVAPLAAALVVTVLPSATAADRPSAGSDGIGDPYFPKYGNGGYQVDRYDIRVGYTPKTRRLHGDTTVVARARKPLRRFNLDLLLRASSVRVNGKPARFRQGRHELVVTPKRALRAGQRMRVRVRYAGRPGRISYGGEQPFLADGRSALAVGQPNIAPWWFPSNDHPSDKARFRVNLRAPKGMRTVSNGRLAGRRTGEHRTTWRWRSGAPMAPYLAFAAWGPYTVKRGKTDADRPYLYAYDKRMGKRTTRKARKAIGATGPVTRFLAKRWGRYPYRHIGGVATASPLGYALENQTRPVYDRTFFAGGSHLANVALVAHEMGHQWFGDAVTMRRWRDIWLNEGYATYSEWMWLAAHGGRSLDRQFQNEYSRPKSSAFWKVPLRDPGRKRIFSEPVYARGAMTLHALRREIGSKAFFELSRRWVHRNADGVGGQREYRRLAERVSGRKLGPFFRSWLRAGKPEA